MSRAPARPASLPEARVIRRLGWLLFGGVLILHGWFYNGYSWNHISRYNAIFAFVEPGTPQYRTFRLDGFVPQPERIPHNTGDWARNPELGPAVYSNKAPGPILLGALCYEGLYRLQSALGWQPKSHRLTWWNTWWLNLLLTVLPLALAAPAMLRLTLTLWPGHAALPRALLLTLTLFFGTLLLPYSSMLWGHNTAAAAVILAYAALWRPGGAAPVQAGLWLGFGVLCEYSVALTVFCVIGWLVWRRAWGELARLCLGGLPLAVIFGLYHTVCFGRPWAIANFYNNPVFIDRERVGGLFGALSWDAVWGLSLSPYRGLFFAMPVLLLALASLAPGVWRGGGAAGRLLFWWANVAGFVLMNLGFNGWHGGACIGPRYLIPALPALVLLIGEAWHYFGEPARRSPRYFQTALLALGLLSLSHMLVITVQSPYGDTKATAEWANPLAYYYGRLLRGEGPEVRSDPFIRLTLPSAHERTMSMFTSPPGMLGLPWGISLLLWLALFLALLHLGTDLLRPWRPPAPAPPTPAGGQEGGTGDRA